MDFNSSEMGHVSALTPDDEVAAKETGTVPTADGSVPDAAVTTPLARTSALPAIDTTPRQEIRGPASATSSSPRTFRPAAPPPITKRLNPKSAKSATIEQPVSPPSKLYIYMPSKPNAVDGFASDDLGQMTVSRDYEWRLFQDLSATALEPWKDMNVNMVAQLRYLGCATTGALECLVFSSSLGIHPFGAPQSPQSDFKIDSHGIPYEVLSLEARAQSRCGKVFEPLAVDKALEPGRAYFLVPLKIHETWEHIWDDRCQNQKDYPQDVDVADMLLWPYTFDELSQLSLIPSEVVKAARRNKHNDPHGLAAILDACPVVESTHPSDDSDIDRVSEDTDGQSDNEISGSGQERGFQTPLPTEKVQPGAMSAADPEDAALHETPNQLMSEMQRRNDRAVPAAVQQVLQRRDGMEDPWIDRNVTYSLDCPHAQRAHILPQRLSDAVIDRVFQQRLSIRGSPEDFYQTSRAGNRWKHSPLNLICLGNGNHGNFDTYETGIIAFPNTGFEAPGKPRPWDRIARPADWTAEGTIKSIPDIYMVALRKSDRFKAQRNTDDYRPRPGHRPEDRFWRCYPPEALFSFAYALRFGHWYMLPDYFWWLMDAHSHLQGQAVVARVEAPSSTSTSTAESARTRDSRHEDQFQGYVESRRGHRGEDQPPGQSKPASESRHSGRGGGGGRVQKRAPDKVARPGIQDADSDATVAVDEDGDPNSTRTFKVHKQFPILWQTRSPSARVCEVPVNSGQQQQQQVATVVVDRPHESPRHPLFAIESKRAVLNKDTLFDINFYLRHQGELFKHPLGPWAWRESLRGVEWEYEVLGDAYSGGGNNEGEAC